MYLDLVSVDLNSTLNRLLHMLCVEVAETKMLNSAVLLEVFQSINVLGVIVLDVTRISDRTSLCWVQEYNSRTASGTAKGRSYRCAVFDSVRRPSRGWHRGSLS